MAEQRARMIYGGIRYFTEDLYTIGRKEATLAGGKLYSFNLNRNSNCLELTIEVKGQKVQRDIPFDTFRFYNLGKPVDSKSPRNSCNKFLSVSPTENYTREEIMRIGNEVASLWGGYCVDCKDDRRKKQVVFNCIEHGERFVTTVGYHELKEYKL